MEEHLRQAHRRWIKAQEQVFEMVAEAEPEDSPIDTAEGMRWAGRLASIARDWIVEKNDPLHPVLFRQQDEYRKFIVDNPDVNYHFCVLDPKQTYRLSGNRGEAPYIGLTLGTDIYAWGSPGGGAMGTLAQAHLDEFALNPDGSFEILLGGEEQPGNWLALPDGTQHLAVRETFTRRDRQRPAKLHIERLGGALPPPQLDPDTFAARLETAASFLVFVAQVCIGMYAGTADHLNRIGGAPGAERVEEQDDEVESHCNTEMAYMGGRWRLAAGEALVVDIHPPRQPFVYWGLTLVNPWCESYDYRFARTCLNNESAVRSPNGDWRLVIAAEDPGVPNWLDTGGRREGKALLRWCLAPGAPNPSCRIVQIDSLAQPAQG